MKQAPSSFLKSLKAIDPRLSVKFVDGVWAFYRVGHRLFNADRLDKRALVKLEQIDTWKNKDYLKDIDRHNDALEAELDHELKASSHAFADALTQRNY